jgi:ribose transport system permease protein
MILERRNSVKPGSNLVIKNVFKSNLFIAVSLTVALFIVGAIINRNFISAGSIGSVLTLSVILGIAASGQTLVVISGGDGLDLSIGASISLGAVISGLTMNGRNAGMGVALVLVIGSGILIGLVNSAGIIYAKVPPLVMTMALANIITTVQLLICDGSPTGKPAPLLSFLGTYRILPFVSILMIFGVLFMVLMHLFLNKTSFGHQLFAVGNNNNAAYLSGVKPNLIRILAYVLSGTLSTLTGFLLLGYNTFVFVNMGSTYVLPTVAAVVIGGTPFAGGKGSFNGTMLGAILLTTLASVLIIINSDSAGRQIINGLALVAILAVYTRQPAIRE